MGEDSPTPGRRVVKVFVRYASTTSKSYEKIDQLSMHNEPHVKEVELLDAFALLQAPHRTQRRLHPSSNHEVKNH